MRWAFLWGCLVCCLMLVSISGCGDGDSQDRIQYLEARLAERNADADRYRQASISCEDLLDAERSKSAELKRAFIDRLPFSVPPELEDDILTLVPVESQAIVEEKLTLFLESLNRRFEDLQASTEAVRREVVQVKRNVEEEGRETRLQQHSQISLLKEELAQNSEELRVQLAIGSKVRGKLSQLLEDIDGFDQREVACQGCWRALACKSKKDDVLGFHADLRSDLRDLLDRSELGNEAQ